MLSLSEVCVADCETIGLYTVFEAPKTAWKELSGIVHDWTLFARAKMRELKKDHELFDVYGDSQDLTDNLFELLQDSSLPSIHSFIVCKDSYDRLQGISTIDKSTNRINALVSNPNNIHKHLLNKIHTIGAGSALMLYCIKKTAEIGTESLKVYSWETAFHFYTEVFLFESIGSDRSLVLELPVEKIRRLISSGIHPFSALLSNT
jgi:hypothetical protein